MEDVIRKVASYDPSGRVIFDPAKVEDLERLESSVGYHLPGDFKRFLRLSNGLIFLSDTFYGIHPDRPDLDIYANYQWERNESNNPLWHNLLPVCPDGGGNHYCLDLESVDEKREKCMVVFWQYDYEYAEDDLPDPEAESFEEFLVKRVNEIIEDYEGQ